MRKIWLLPFLFLLAACAAGGGAPTESQQSAESYSSNSTGDSPSETVPAQSVPVQELNNDITIGTNPAEAGVVRERDWTEGAEDPLVTIIEYGDFQ